eukprot:CAMPEP_0175782440 /NCGR_PEP_ID=MMETSP0097-20121207/77781_1 /TAXON_ID=311494 /ORGANISM="Alexandrium monilatum, Strain CCMP3105" /LENGTH=217 /DNA_ID=CAMNT_0017093255 /DNA_START=87 /DNA_END=736 /DNA_ORIENTATION=+
MTSTAGGPLKQRPTLVKNISQFASGEEGDPEGYAYPTPKDTEGDATEPTSVLRLVGQFFYHAHSQSQCRPNPCAGWGQAAVPAWHVRRVVPLHMRKAFCNYYHFTTVGLARVVALLPQLLADPSLLVLIPHPNRKAQSTAFIAESLRMLGVPREQVVMFPPCKLVFAQEVLIAGAGPRVVFGRGPDGRDRAVMADVADSAPARAVRGAVRRAARYGL